MHTHNANLISKPKALHSFLIFRVQMQRVKALAYRKELFRHIDLPKKAVKQAKIATSFRQFGKKRCFAKIPSPYANNETKNQLSKSCHIKKDIININPPKNNQLLPFSIPLQNKISPTSTNNNFISYFPSFFKGHYNIYW